jgi:hypothetical protein
MSTARSRRGPSIGAGALCGVLTASAAYAALFLLSGSPRPQPSVRMLLGYLLLVVPCGLNGALAAWESGRSNTRRFLILAALPVLVVVISLPFGHGAVWTAVLVAILAWIAGWLAQEVGLRLRSWAGHTAA